jgi:hypothetical protein
MEKHSQFAIPEEPVKDIGWARQQLVKGKTVRRKGWNGKGMFIFMVKGIDVYRSQLTEPVYSHYPITQEKIHIQSRIDMKTADGSIAIGWVCSQADFFAEDWELAEG